MSPEKSSFASPENALRVLVQRASVAFALGVVVSPAAVRANTPDDLGGVGARASAMGGAGTALVEDFSAAYYNLANTTRCEDNQLGFDMRLTHFSPSLQATLTDGDDLAEDALRTDSPGTTVRAGFGFCLPLPYGFAAGMWMAFGVPSPLRIGLGTVDSQPTYPLYGPEREQLSIMLGVAYRPIDQLAIGIGASVLVNTSALISADVGVAASGSIDIQAEATVDVTPRAGVVVGVDVEPTPGLHFGATYRQSLFHDLYAEAEVNVEGVDVLACLSAQGWFSPHQVALGASWDAHPNLTVAADVTWYDWSRHPTSFINVWVPENGGCSAPAELLYANSAPSDVGFRDIWQPRVGAEYALDSGWSLRAGYSFRPSILRSGAGRDQESTVLDSSTHTVTGGIGYALDVGESTVISLDVHGRGSFSTEDDRVTMLTNASGGLSPGRLTYGALFLEAGFTASLRWE